MERRNEIETYNLQKFNVLIHSPGTPDKELFNSEMFSEKKFHEILEKSKEKVRYKAQADIKEEEEEPVFNSTE